LPLGVETRSRRSRLTISESNLSLAAMNDSPVSAALIRDGEGWRYSASAPVRASVIFVLPADASAKTTWTV
jgi:hypothetical protein